MTSESSWSWSHGLAAGSSVLISTEPSFWTVTLPVNGRPSSWPLSSAREAGEIAPLGAMCDRLLEESDRFGVRVMPLQRPGEGQRGELADLVVFLGRQSAGLLERLAGVDRIAARSRGAPGGRAVRTGLDRLLAQCRNQPR